LTENGLVADVPILPRLVHRYRRFLN